jgi:Flp pilus assembly protein TadD
MSRSIRVRSLLGLIAGGLWLAALPAWAAADAGSAADLDGACKYGVWLAQHGRIAEAETVFVSLYARAPQDARILNNLGKVYLLLGERRTALAFYRKAESADSADANIVFNRAKTMYLMGDDSLAVVAAHEAVARAGGGERARSTLGLAADTTGKAADMSSIVRFAVKRGTRGRAQVSVQELNALATQAAAPRKPAGVPAAPDTGSGGAVAMGSDPKNPATALAWKQ